MDVAGTAALLAERVAHEMALMGLDPHPATLVCEQCLEESEQEARGWIALLAEGVHGLEPMSVAVFCPECARVEFEYRTEAEDLS